MVRIRLKEYKEKELVEKFMIRRGEIRYNKYSKRKLFKCLRDR